MGNFNVKNCIKLAVAVAEGTISRKGYFEEWQAALIPKCETLKASLI